MSYEALRSSRKRTVGTRETSKALQKGQVRVLYLARDAEEYVIRDLRSLSEKKGIPIVYIDTMAKLGEVCGIEVGAASAAILED